MRAAAGMRSWTGSWGEKKKMGKQRAVFFDVDDTLYDHLEPLRQALDRLISPTDGFPYEQV